jgi:hypothetical protein
VFGKIIISNKLDLFQATCFVIPDSYERQHCFPAVMRPFRLIFKTDANEVTGAADPQTNEQDTAPGGSSKKLFFINTEAPAKFCP